MKAPEMMRGITRRTFVQTATAIGATLAMGGTSLVHAAKPPRGAVSRNPLYIPPVLSPSAVSLGAAPARFDLGGGKMAWGLGYNGNMPGPTFAAARGANVDVTLQNGLTEPTTVHWHGMVVGTPVDGHPMHATAPGGSFNYRYPINQRAALNWYHPHPHMLTGKQVNLGLAGAFIVRDSVEDALNLPAGNREVPLIIRDANLDKSGNLIYNPQGCGFAGKLSMVNGTLDPKLDVATAVYRFRVLNGANSRLFRLALGNGAPFVLIGNDGGLLPRSVPVGSIEFGPGERLDLLIDFRGLPLGSKVMLQDLNSGWGLLEFIVTSQVSDTWTIPTVLSTVNALTGPSAVTRTFSFEGMSRINGKRYDMHRIDFNVPLGVVERWRFTTNGNAPHPVHVHGASFQVVSRSGGRGMLFPWERGWKDTVLLHDGETVDVMIRFDLYKGIYLMHCHKLEHEDMGMMLNFEVV